MSNEQLPQQHDENQGLLSKEGEHLPVKMTKKRKRKWHIFLWMIGIVIVLDLSRMITIFDPPPSCPNNQVCEEILCQYKQQITPTIEFVEITRNGETYRVILDAEKYSIFVQEQFHFFEKNRKELQLKIRASLSDELAPIFQEMKQQSPRFADWYFAYSTTYAILFEALYSITTHSVDFFEKKKVSELVATDLQEYIQKYYSNIILQPAINNSHLVNAYKSQLKVIENEWKNILVHVQDRFQVFVKNNTNHSSDNCKKEILKLDWHGHLNKINFVDYQRSHIEVLSMALITTTGVKAAGAVAAAKAAKTALLSKLASPFVTKAVTIGGMGAVGTIGGPLGTVIGITGGIGLDFFISKGIELMQRSEFIHDTEKAIQSTQDAWEELMRESLDKTIQIWFDDSIQLLPKYETTQK